MQTEAFGVSYFLSASNKKARACSQHSEHRPMPVPSFSSRAKMLEIDQGINAGRVNSGSTAKCLKTQSFYSQVNSSQSTCASLSAAAAVQVAVLNALICCSERLGPFFC